MIHTNSLTHLVVNYVRDNPGVTRGMILKSLPEDAKARSVSSILTHLARGGAIENRGSSGLAARWFPIEIVVTPRFRAIARELIAELKAVHHSQREDFLARRLQEIFGEDAV